MSNHILNTNTILHTKDGSKTNINENNIIEAICLAEKVIEILDKKCRKGCTNSAWIGFQNGEGTECGIDIEHLIKQAKQLLNNNQNVIFTLETKKNKNEKV